MAVNTPQTAPLADRVPTLQARAVVIESPQRLGIHRVELDPPGPSDVVVDIAWSGISTGTERLLWSGEMPAFPGMGYPLIPGYESVGDIVAAGTDTDHRVGDRVFVPGARCFGEVRGLFGGAASRLVVDGTRVRVVPDGIREEAVLLALAATAWHALDAGIPELVVGHGVLGRLITRVARARGAAPPAVWETDPRRRHGADGYSVLAPETDPRTDYACICDVSGDPSLLDTLIGRLGPGGEVILAGFYSDRLSFAFAPAFVRETRLRVAAEWRPADLDAVVAALADARLSLDGLISHRRGVDDAAAAYRVAFEDPGCLKMLLDWSESP